MSRIDRQEFKAILVRHGPIDLGNRSDPVSSAVRDLGITDSDLKGIGDGDLVIRGSDEVDALFDKLTKLDAQKPLPGAQDDRASRLSGVMRANRAAFLAPPPALKGFAELKTRDDFQDAGAAIQAAPVLTALETLKRPVAMPKEIRVAAALAADNAADPVARGAARARVLAWTEAQAASTSANAKDLTAQIRHIEGLIGPGANGRPGYYEGVINDARTFVARAEARAAKGDTSAKADVTRGKKVLAWAEREQEAARAVYRRLIVDAADTSRVLGGATSALDETVKLRVRTGALQVRFAELQDKLHANVEGSADAGQLRPELYDSREWITEAGRVKDAIKDYRELIVTLETRANGDANFRAWLTTSGTSAQLDVQLNGLLVQQAEIDRLILGQAGEPIKGRTIQSARREAEAQYIARQSVAALTVEGDGQLEVREAEMRKYRTELRGELGQLKDQLKASKAKIAHLESEEKKRPLNIDEVYQLRTERLKVEGVLLDDKGKPISLEQEINKLENADFVLAKAITAVDGRRQDLAEVLGSIGVAYGHGLKPGGSNLDLMHNIKTLEGNAHVPGFDVIATKDKGDVLVLTLPGKDGKATNFRLAKDSSFAEARAFVAAYAHQHAWQTMRAYEVSRLVLMNQYGFKNAELNAMGLAPLSEGDAKKPGYVEQRLGKILGIVSNVTGRNMSGEDLRNYMEWTLNPQNAVPKAAVSNAEITEEGALHLYNFLVDRKQNSYYLTRDQLLKIIQDPEILSDGIAKTKWAQDLRAPVFEASAAALEVVRAIVRDPALQAQLGMSEAGYIKSENFLKWYKEWTAIKKYAGSLPAPPPGAPQGGKSVTPEFFPGADRLVDSFGPTQKHIDAGNHFFERTTWLTEGQRAYVFLLYEAKYGKEASLKVQLPNLRASHGENYRWFMQEENAHMAAPRFEKQYLKVEGGTDKLLKDVKQKRQWAQEYIDNGLPGPPHVIKGFDERLASFEAKNNERNIYLQDRAKQQIARAEMIKNKEPTAAIDEVIADYDKHIAALEKDLRKLGPELMVLGDALWSGEKVMLTWHNNAVQNMRDFGKGLAIMAAAMAVSYLTAGRAAPYMRPIAAGAIGLMSGTAAGVGVAFWWDVGEQVSDKGWRNVDLDQSKRSAINAIPQAAMGAAGVGFALPRMAAFNAAVAAGKITSNGIKIGGLVSISGDTVLAARGAFGMGVYAGATTYIGKVGSAAFYLARNDPKENDLANAEASLKGLNRETILAVVTTPLLMGFSRYKSLTKGAGGLAFDSATNMIQKGLDNWIAGNPIGKDMLAAGVTGAFNGKMMNGLGSAIQASQRLKASRSEGAKVRLPNEHGAPSWTVKGVHAETGHVVVEGGKPPRIELVSADQLVTSNPQLANLALKDPPAMTRGIGSGPEAPAPKTTKNNQAAQPDPLLLRSTGALVDTAQAPLLFQPGSGFVLRKFVLAKDIVFHDVSIRADGTVVGRRSTGAKIGPLKNLDGSPLTALDLARTSPGALLPMGLKLHDPATGHSFEVKDTFGSAHLFVEERNAAGKIVDTTEMTASQLIAKGLHVDDPYTGRRAMFDSATVDAAKKRVPVEPPPETTPSKEQRAPSPTSENATVPGKKPAPSPTSENATVPGKKPAPARMDDNDTVRDRTPVHPDTAVDPPRGRTTQVGHEPAPGPTPGAPLPPPPPTPPRAPEPSVAGQPLRVLRTDLEQHVLQLLGPSLRQQLGATDIDVKTRVAANADGTVEMKVSVRPFGGNRPVAELTMTVDPNARTVRIDDLTTTSQLVGLGGDRRMLTVAADFLGKNFEGWNVNAQAQGTLGRAFGQLFEQTGNANGTLTGRVREPGFGLNPPPAPNTAWNNLAVAGIDRNAATVSVQVGTTTLARPIADVLIQRPALVDGMPVVHNNTRYRVGGLDANGEFHLIPVDPAHSRTTISGEDLYRAAPDAIDARIGAPPVRARIVRIEDGEPIAHDLHGYTLAGIDRQNGTAQLRNLNTGAIETWALDQVSFEHSGVALGALNPAQHNEYQTRLNDMAHPQAWGHIRAKAVSPAHASLADQAFAAHMPLEAIDSMLTSLRDVPHTELSKLFSGADQVQHGSTTCVAAACLFGISRKNPMLTRFLADHPSVGAWWQRMVVEGHTTGGVQNRQDAHYPNANQPFTQREVPTQATPTRTADGRSFYDASNVHVDTALRTLNDPASWMNHEAVVTIGPNQTVRITGDANGNLSVKLPGQIRGRRVTSPLFRAGFDAHGRPVIEVHLNNQRVGVAQELGLPSGMPVPKLPNGMFLHNDPYLTSLISMAEGVPYFHSDVSGASRPQMFASMNASLRQGHGVPFAVNWYDPATGLPAGSGHQLWVDQHKTVNGVDQYLVHDPWFEGSRWITQDQLYRYSPIPGSEGRPAYMSLPTTVVDPGTRVGGPIAHSSVQPQAPAPPRSPPLRAPPVPKPDFLPDPVEPAHRPRAGLRPR